MRTLTLVPEWANWEHFNELDKRPDDVRPDDRRLWIYIGSQGIVQGTYETFGSVSRQHFNGDAKGKWVLTGGLGGMGGAQPLAATMAGFVCWLLNVTSHVSISVCALVTWIIKLLT